MRAAIAIAVAVAMSGCAVQKTLTPIGGSRSDGIVRLAYTVAMFEKPVVDEQAAARTAAQRCAAWGYSDAELFGGHTTTCINSTYQGCNEWQVTVEYQCTGQPEAAVLPVPVPVPTPAPAVAPKKEGTTQL